MHIRDYIYKVHKLIEVPRNELRYKVVTNQGKVYQKLLEQYEIAYLEKCLIIEKLLDEEVEYLRRFRQID